MKSVKILMVTRLFPSRAFPNLGTFCAERVKALSRYADVRVLVPTPYWPRWLPIGPWKKMARVEPKRETEEGVPVWYPRYPMLPWIATWLQGCTMAMAVRRAAKLFPDNWLPDIVDGQFTFPDGYAAVRLAERLGCPSVVTCHGSDLKLYPSLVITRSMLQRTLQRANRVISVSTWLRTRSIELGCEEADAVFLTNGVDIDRFAVRDRGECRRRLESPLEGKVAVCVGHLNDNKNQSVLIRALAGISSKGMKPPHLVLVGDGPNRQRLEREAEQFGVRELVRFAGNRPHEEIPYWMGAGDWLMLSSHYEGWATVYFEAMACGRPVITSDVPSAKDCVCDERYGMVVKPNTPEAFADAMIRAQDKIYDPDVIRAYAEENSWDRWARKMMDIIAQVRGTSEK
jgi:glycosyltransferase involved in cell wall biosynthesis